MTEMLDAAGEVPGALRSIVADPHFGPAVLSRPQVMSSVLKDLLPDSPREAGLIVAAAEADLAGGLRTQVDRDLPVQAAIRLVAERFQRTTAFSEQACTWVTSEFAVALGLVPAGGEATRVLEPQTVLPPGAVPAGGADGSATGAHAAVRHGRVAALALAGAVLVLIAMLVPFVKITGGGSFTIWNAYHMPQKFWVVAYPIVVAVLIAGAAVVLRSSEGARLTRLVPGALIATGIQTVLYFAFYAFEPVAPDHHRWGGRLGVIAGVVVLAAGWLSARSGGTAAIGPGALTQQAPASR